MMTLMLKLLCVLFSSGAVLCENEWQIPLVDTAKVGSGRALAVAKQASLKARRIFLASRAHNTGSACTRCTGKAYSEPCPGGWSEALDGTCIAPASYRGNCARKQSFLASSFVEKQEAELVCHICWPCPKDPVCERDWGLPCPIGYSAKLFNVGNESEPICEADLDYQGGCEPQVEFSSEEEKHEFAERCSVSWPCKSTCKDLRRSTCPLGWASLGSGTCEAPSTFRGCESLQGFQGWTDAMKLDYAERCHVAWPCVPSEDVKDGPVGTASCPDLDLRTCPNSWTISTDGYCQPPIATKGPCKKLVMVGTMTKEQKLKWAGDCLLTWPCVGERNAGSSRQSLVVDTDMNGPIDVKGTIG